jgi:hypothetical protein
MAILGAAAIMGGATVGSSLLGGLFGSQGADAAAKAQKEAAEKAMMFGGLTYGAAQKNLAPAINLGKAAAGQYRTALPALTDVKQYEPYYSPYTEARYKESPLYTPMVRNLAELQATPGYQFQLEQGLQAQNMGAAARGGLLSGAQQQALQQYGQGLASTGFQSAWERAQNAYKSAFEANQALGRARLDANQQAAGIYGNATGLGSQAAGTLAGVGTNVMNTVTGAQQQIGQANAVSAAAPYQAMGNAVGAIGSGISGLAGMGAFNGLFSPSTNMPMGGGNYQAMEKAITPNFQSLGGTPSSSQSVYSGLNGSSFWGPNYGK